MHFVKKRERRGDDGRTHYQLKSVWKDKFCIMSFLLPVIVALALRLIGGIDLSSVTEFHFGVLEGELSERTLSWLEGYGSVNCI